MIDNILAFFAPHYCYGCGKTGLVLCDNCKYNIINEAFSICVGCQGPALQHGMCKRCKAPFDRAWVVDGYHGPLGEAIKGMKIVSMRQVAATLGDVLVDSLPALPSHVVVVPIPTVRAHVRQRGFDHTKIIAGVVAKRQKVPLVNVLRRVGHAAQRGATAAQRRVQAKEAFTVEGVLDPELIYLLIDDVVTTSATIREAGRQLRLAGAREVWVAALTRETLDDEGRI